ncbi:hypothetical protein B0H19DRAFT_1062071 [Mycena capillaripes]|nr:hypothetical protein B0H19DRAFT_1062071 [Mycena capillaripes]
MSSICRTLFMNLRFWASLLLMPGVATMEALQLESDQHGFASVFGFNSSGPFDAAGNPILSLIAQGSNYAFEAWICGQVSPNAYPQTTFGPVISATLNPGAAFCLTISELEVANATISLQPCVNEINANPVPTQMFQWIGTAFITYGFAFLGNQSVPVDPSATTDYTPSLAPATNTTAAYLRLDYTPGGLPASTGFETGMILDLSDD